MNPNAYDDLGSAVVDTIRMLGLVDQNEKAFGPGQLLWQMVPDATALASYPAVIVTIAPGSESGKVEDFAPKVVPGSTMLAMTEFPFKILLLDSAESLRDPTLKRPLLAAYQKIMNRFRQPMRPQLENRPDVMFVKVEPRAVLDRSWPCFPQIVSSLVVRATIAEPR